MSLTEPDAAYIDPLILLAPTAINLSKLAGELLRTENLAQIQQVFTAAYLKGASTGDSDLLEWLLATHNHQQYNNNKNNNNNNNNNNSNNKIQTIKEETDSNSDSGSSVSSSSHHSNKHAETISLKPGQPRQWIDLEARDEDGSPAIILAAAFGHAEAVRAIVDGLGDQVVDRRDAVGWTALHWAARNGDLTIVSYLLNHGASTSLVSFTDRPPSDRSSSILLPPRSRLSTYSTSTLTGSDTRSPIQSDDETTTTSTTTTPRRPKRRRTRAKGLRPYDLAKKDEQGETIREILRIAEQAKTSTHSRHPSQASIRSIRLAEVQSEAELAKSESKKIIQLAKLCSETLEIHPSLLGLEPIPNDPLDHKPFMFNSHPHPHNHNHNPHTHTQSIIKSLMASSQAEWEQEQQAEEFLWDRCEPDQMIVCSLDELEGVFEAVIKTMEPQQARHNRFVPANVLFFCARFAAHMGTVELLEEVLLGAVDRIEETIFARQQNMANSTFWLFNSICLLYYIRREPLLQEMTTPDIQLHLEDLVNEIYVFIIRDAERRLDKLIDSTLLDFEPLPGIKVDFEPEGSWRFVRALTVKRNRTTSFRPSIPRFNTSNNNKVDGSSNNNNNTTTITTQGQSPKLSSSPLSSISLPSSHGPRTTSAPNQSTPLSQPPPSLSSSTGTLKTPKLITDLLSSVLYLLQAYEIHGSVIVQIFSQIIYWLSCETFNRIISRRKYLCRSKAMQIHLNVTTIEEWGRGNRLPAGVVQKHFEPLRQLLKWIECLTTSGAQSFDQLIEIVSSLKTLNPAQLLKVSRDYRFEVDEPKLSEECRQYLVQTQQDWDRRRIQSVSELEQQEKLAHSPLPSAGLPPSPHPLATGSSDGAAEKNDGPSKALQAIDAAFGTDDVEAYGSYAPPVAPQCLGELLDSRQMLPFSLPTAIEVLMNLRRTVPFGSLKTYVIPDEPKPGSHWWATSPGATAGGSSRSLSEDEEDEDGEEEDGDEDEHEAARGEDTVTSPSGFEDRVARQTPRVASSLRLASSSPTHPLPASHGAGKEPLPGSPFRSPPSHPISPPLGTPPSIASCPKPFPPANHTTPSCRKGIVPIVSPAVLKRIDRCLFKSSTAPAWS
ncbi:hypothetical protein PCANC_19394 [Puccinia coronata f. sp. avenae]|uniref:Dilute domain-containing protein n=1 Tax=Puccinia coronata f. sp. avenae TaxID=200324 RepID=A0A2N5SKT2_9BASI|nr:hypothetical protein PCANC_19394 [Puccinia coronata f. sp. avenae]